MKLSQLYPGDKVLDPHSGILFTVAGVSPYGEGTLLISDRILSVGAMDAPEPSSDEENYRITGNSDYILSNLNQWLNSDAENWYSPAHDKDTPPSEEFLSIRPTLYDPIGHNAYDNRPGFLSRFSESFKALIKTSTIPCAEPDNSGLRMHRTKVFLPSAAELGLDTIVVKEGEELPLFRDFKMRYASPCPECLSESEWQPAYFRENRIFWYWMRTPNVSTKGFFLCVHTTTPFTYKFACSPWMGIRPMLALDKDTEITQSGNIWGHFRIKEVSL